jgi:hypothetical protein
MSFADTAPMLPEGGLMKMSEDVFRFCDDLNRLFYAVTGIFISPPRAPQL